MRKVTWRRFDQSAKQLVVGQTTISNDDLVTIEKCHEVVWHVKNGKWQEVSSSIPGQSLNQTKGLEHKPDHYEKRDFEKTRKTVVQSKISLTCKDSYHILSITEQNLLQYVMKSHKLNIFRCRWTILIKNVTNLHLSVYCSKILLMYVFSKHNMKSYQVVALR